MCPDTTVGITHNFPSTASLAHEHRTCLCLETKAKISHTVSHPQRRIKRYTQHFATILSSGRGRNVYPFLVSLTIRSILPLVEAPTSTYWGSLLRNSSSSSVSVNLSFSSTARLTHPEEQGIICTTMTASKRKSDKMATPVGLRTPPSNATPGSDQKSAKRVKTEVLDSPTKAKDTKTTQDTIG